MSPVRVPWPSLGCLTRAVLWTFGVASTQLRRHLPGLGGMVSSPPELICLAALIPGLRPLRPVIFFLSLDFCFFDWRHRQNWYSSLTKWWEVCKEHIKGLSISYGVAKSGEGCSQRDLLVRLAEHLKSKLDLGNLSCLGPYNSTLAELAKFDLKVAQGAQVRSRIR